MGHFVCVGQVLPVLENACETQEKQKGMDSLRSTNRHITC